MHLLPNSRNGRLGILLLCWISGCTQASAPEPASPAGVLTAGFVALESVYNSELMAPYDVLQHSVFRDSVNYIAPFVVSVR